MDLREWREKRKGEKYVLPSGLVATVQRCDLLDLAERGQIPAPLAAIANKLVTTGVLVTVENFQEYAAGVDLLARVCIVDPPVAEEPDEEHVGIHELPMKDRIAVYNWANEGAALLTPFRAESGEPADAGRHGNPLRAKTKHNSRRRRPMAGLPGGPGDVAGSDGPG
jgi:hypothetical protein